MIVHLAVAGGVFDDVTLCYSFSRDLSWMKSGTEFRQFLRIFLPILMCFSYQISCF